MTDKELKRMVKKAYNIKPSRRKTAFIAKYQKHKISFLKILFMQLKYMGIPLALAFVLLLSMLFAALADTDMRLSAITSFFMPVIALILLTGLGKSERYTMNELEMSSRFSLRMVKALRLMICGITGIVATIIASVIMSIIYHTNLISVLMSCNALYLAAVSVCIIIIRRWHSNKNIYGCVIGTFCIVLISLFCNQCLAKYSAEILDTVMATVLFASLIITIIEAYKFIKESEELSWNLC